MITIFWYCNFDKQLHTLFHLSIVSRLYTSFLHPKTRRVVTKITKI